MEALKVFMLTNVLHKQLMTMWLHNLIPQSRPRMVTIVNELGLMFIFLIFIDQSNLQKLTLTNRLISNNFCSQLRDH